ncbi:MAG: S-layer homology domain-containing protein [Oscillospiraceae bacterium]|jgi:hypothetical protein|nr:S-layer homology domain-containing protein [Oscillospiraceae bacterium]
MKKRLLTILLTLTLTVGVIPFAAFAADAPSSWAAEPVNAAIKAGLVPQSLQSKYTQPATRAEYCALAVALYEKVTGKAITKRATFSDTTDVNVEKAAAIGVVNGMGNNKFDPDAKLTREQAAVMLARLADAIGKPLAKKAATFADNAKISSWAVEQVGQVQAAGIMSGIEDNKFAPKGPYTREQSIITILRSWNYANGITTPPPAPTYNWPNLSGPKVFWNSSIYQSIIDYAATQDGVTAHIEIMPDKVVIYLGSKWPVMRYDEWVFSISGVFGTTYSWQQSSGIFFNHGGEWLNKQDMTNDGSTLVDIASYFYRDRKDREPYVSNPPGIKFPWE